MKEKDTIFLSYAEALKAVQNDLEQYPPQPLLFRHIAQLILGEKIHISEDKQRTGLWVGIDKKCKCRLITYDQLPRYLCSALEKVHPPLDLLAKICGCVFQEKAYPGSQNPGGEKGVSIETGMEDFICLQCGQCCRFLDYHQELTHEDYLMWRNLGRTDIIKRVGLLRNAGEIVAYRMWIDPVTRKLSGECPWLKNDSEKNRYTCQIHDVRPKICRQYPGSRKHARMTGCRAFDFRSGKTHKKTA